MMLVVLVVEKEDKEVEVEVALEMVVEVVLRVVKGDMGCVGDEVDCGGGMRGTWRWRWCWRWC